MAGFAADLPSRWNGRRVLIVGHLATHFGLDHLLLGTPLEELISRPREWQPGWEYTLG